MKEYAEEDFEQILWEVDNPETYEENGETEIVEDSTYEMELDDAQEQINKRVDPYNDRYCSAASDELIIEVDKEDIVVRRLIVNGLSVDMIYVFKPHKVYELSSTLNYQEWDIERWTYCDRDDTLSKMLLGDLLKLKAQYVKVVLVSTGEFPRRIVQKIDAELQRRNK